MWFGWFRKKSIPEGNVTITRNDLRKLIFRSCDHLDSIPLNKAYRLVPSKGWVKDNTPKLGTWKQDYNDCNHFALKAMCAMQTHCFGMVIVRTTNQRISHALNIFVTSAREVLFYDPSSKEIKAPGEMGKVMQIWI